MAAPIIDSTQRGAELGGMLTSAGQAGLARLQQAFQFGQQFSNQQRQQEVTREQADQHLAMQLSARHNMQSQAIDAAARRQKQAADDALKRSVVQAGLTEQLAEQRFEQEMLVARERAKAQAQNVEYTYTTKQRIEDAKFARAEQMIRDSPNFSTEEKQIALQRLQVARAGIRQPTEILGDPNKPKFPEGREPGQVWQGSDGGWFSTEPDGSVKLQVRPDQTPEYLQKKQANELEIKQKEWEAKREAEEVKARLALDKLKAEKRIELLTEEVTTIGSDGSPSTRHRSPDEVDEILASAFGGEKRKQDGWWESAQQQGYVVDESDLEYPQAVGGSRAFLRTMQKQYGSFDAIPEQLKPTAEAAARVIAAYDRK